MEAMMKNFKLLIIIVMVTIFMPMLAWAFMANEQSISALTAYDENDTNAIKVAPNDCRTEDQFGRAVDVSGKNAIVGAYGNDDRADNAGAAYLLHFDGHSWQPAQKLSAIDGDEYDYFGCSVAIDNNHAIIGAYGDDDHGNNSGSAYIFEKDDNSWYELAKLKAQDSKSSDYFGCSVDISGNYIIVGAYGAMDNGSHSGAAYIFSRDNNGIYQQQKLLAGDAQPFDYFGYAVSISGDYAIIGAYGKSYHGEKSGAAYIFKRMGRRWCQLIKLAPSDGAKNDYFGRSVSISGEYAIIGAIGKDDNGTDAGAAYIFKRTGYYWSRFAKIIPSNLSHNYCFGTSVNISDGYAIVGALGDNMNGVRTGAAYVYQRQQSKWNQIALFRPQDGSDDDFFGCSVAISGHQIIAGAYGNDENGERSGAAYLYGLLSTYVNTK
jgi:hypothetical protein